MVQTNTPIKADDLIIFFSTSVRVESLMDGCDGVVIGEVEVESMNKKTSVVSYSDNKEKKYVLIIFKLKFEF